MTLFWHLDLSLATKELPCNRSFFFQDIVQGAARNNLAAMDPCARANVDHKIRVTDGFFVMFNNNDSIAQVSQASQRTEKSLVVSLVQPD